MATRGCAPGPLTSAASIFFVYLLARIFTASSSIPVLSLPLPFILKMASEDIFDGAVGIDLGTTYS